MYSFSYLEPVLFHVQFYLLLPDLHTGFSRGRSGGLVFSSPSEFSTVYCDPHSQRRWHIQEQKFTEKIQKNIASFPLLIWSKDKTGKVSAPLPALNTEVMCHTWKGSQLWWDWEAVTSGEAEGVTKVLDFTLLSCQINGDLASSRLLGSCS